MSALIGGQNLTKTLIFSQIISGEYNGIVVPVQVLVCLANMLRGNFSGTRYFSSYGGKRPEKIESHSFFKKCTETCKNNKKKGEI